MDTTDRQTLVTFLEAVSDHFKHITTLSSGFILVIATFWDRLFIDPSGILLAQISVGCFVLAIVASVLAQAAFIDYLRQPDRYEPAGRAELADHATFVAWLAFLAGVVSLAVFTIRNLSTAT